MMYRCVTILVLGVFLAIVWTAQAPYLHDFGEWVYQSKILTLYWTQPDEVAGFQWTGSPVPNILAILIMAVLGLIFPAISAAKLFLSLLLVGWYFVLKRFVGELDGVDHPNALMLLLFSLIALSNFFWTGFVSYQLGLLLLTFFLTRFKANMSVKFEESIGEVSL